MNKVTGFFKSISVRTIMLVTMIAMVAITCLAFGADGTSATTAATDTVSIEDFFKAVFAAIAGMKGMAPLAIVAVCVQLVMMLFRTSLMDFAGKWKLLIVAILSLVGSFIAVMAGGGTWVQALLDGATITAIQVLIHQVYVQFISKKDEVKS